MNKRSEITTLKGHTDFVYSVAFSPDRKLLVSGSGDKTVKLWNNQNRNEISYTLWDIQNRNEIS